VIRLRTLRTFNELNLDLGSKRVAHYNDIKLLSIKVCVGPSELYTDGAHLVGWNALIVNPLIIIVHHALRYIYSNDLMRIWSQ
jgi:hypothetical protein